MTGTNYEWVERELDLRGHAENSDSTQKKIRKAVLELLHTLDAQSLNKRDRQTTAELVLDLVATEKVAVTDGESTWTNFRVGEHRPGMTVRVRRDAYEGSGAKHNGLTATVTAVRGGRVLVQYLGRSDGVGHAHHPDMLEVLVKG